MLAACLCGALFCTQVNAKVCFVGDPDCAQGAEFEEYTPPATDSLCTQEGYTTKASECANVGAVCPYDASFVRCCGAKYVYQACIYPLEYVKNGDTVDKCGKLYACKCPAEYKITAETAKNNNCDPLGVCMVNEDGTGDKVYYKTCDCNRTIYTDVSSCRNNQDESASCTDDTGATYKKCYCDRSTAKYPYAACEYGSKGAVCVDSNSNREYYHQCKSARERCLEENYIAATVSDCPYGPTACTSSVSGRKYYCALGDGCPYPTVPQLYKCQFDKGRWCKNNGYGQESSTPMERNSSCIDLATGLEGKTEPCPENTDTPIFYYRCKLTCAQRAQLGVTKTNDLIQDTGLANAGIRAYYNVMGDQKKLYVAEGGVVPTANKENWKDIGSKIDFESINGIHALCERGSDYMECCEERDKSNSYLDRPVLKFDGMAIDAANNWLNKNMSDIEVQIYSSNTSDKGGYGEEYIVSNATWNNVTISEANIADLLCSEGEGHSSKVYYASRDNCRDAVGNFIRVNGGSTLTMTGNMRFELLSGTRGGCGNVGCKNGYSSSSLCGTGQWWCPKHNDPYLGTAYSISPTRFYVNGSLIFKNATIYSYSNVDFDGPNNGSMFFYNSKGNMGRVWSHWNIGLENSDISFNLLRTIAYASANNRFGGWADNEHGRFRCHGVYAANSTINITSNYGRIEGSNFKFYLGYGSKLTSRYPIELGGLKSDAICVNNGATAKINGRTYSGTSVIYGWTNTMAGENAFYSGSSEWGNNMYAGCNGDKCSGCWYSSSPKCLSASGYYCNTDDGGSTRNTAFYPHFAHGSSIIFCTACDTCEVFGMGY